MREFIECLFEPDDLVEVRAVAGGADPIRHFRKAGRLVDLAGELRGRSGEGRDIFYGVNPRLRRGGKKADVALARCLFADIEDIDTAQAEARIGKAGLPAPTAMMNSGHGVHAFWRLVVPITDLAEWSTHQKALAAALGSDPVVFDLPRCGRMPGYVNHKSPPAMSRLIDADPARRYELAALLAGIGGGGLLEAAGDATESAESAESAEKTESIEKTEKTEKVGKVEAITSIPTKSLFEKYAPQIEFAIRSTLPAREGKRHKQVFELARALKAIAEIEALPAGALKPVVRQCHALALREKKIRTEIFDVTWADFVTGWPNVKFPAGQGQLDGIYREVKERCLRGEAEPEAQDYDSEPIKVLVGLLAELQRKAGAGVIRLNTHKAGALFGVSYGTAARWLRMLEADGLLVEVEHGRPGRDTRWRWVGRRVDVEGGGGSADEA